jgi:hypothetical protein
MFPEEPQSDDEGIMWPFMYRKQQKKKLVMTSVDKISPRWSYTNAGLKYFSLHIHSDISRTFLVKKSFDLFSN